MASNTSFVIWNIGAATRIYKRGGWRTIWFLEWQADQECTNLKLVSQLVLNYVLAIYVFNVGVRYNDINLINSARLKFDDFFYAFKHPIYCVVEYRDLKNRVLYERAPWQKYVI